MISVATIYRLVGLKPSPAQLALAKAVCGEPLSLEEQQIRKLCTGEDCPPKRYQEATIIEGRKSGKTEYTATPILIHRAATDVDAPGIYLLVAPAMAGQARFAWTILVRQIETGYPGLIADTREAEGRLLLRNGNEIRFAWANFRYLRGPKYKVVAIDEACFFVSDSPDDGGANPLEYILDSVAGGMITTAHPLLMLLSTPWNKSGTVWEHFRTRAANPDRLVWRADTLTMNPYANRELMERHRQDRGENFYNREYGAIFCEDSLAYIDAESVDAAVSHGNALFPPEPGLHYCMGLDPGRKRDHFGAAIAFRDGDRVICAWSAEWRPGLFGLKYADVFPEIWAKAREYRITKIASDQVDFGGIEASIPTADGMPEFELEHVQTGGAAGAELSDVTRALFAQRRLVLPDQYGLAEEFKRLADYLTQGGCEGHPRQARPRRSQPRNYVGRAPGVQSAVGRRRAVGDGGRGATAFS